MLGLLLGMHAGAPQPMALEPQQQEEEGCVSLTPNVPAAWCDTTCGPAPRSEQCKPICKCPVSELSKVPAPPAPEPRIIGGWTDCGPETGVEEWLAKWVLNPEIEDKACKTDEGAISAAFVNPAGKPARDPSYSHAWGSNAILPGRFGGGAASPIVGSGKDYTYHWLTVGGQDTDSKSWMETVEHDVLEAGAKGVAFDIEGGVTTKDMLAWIKTMRPKHPDWTYVHVPDTAEGPVTWNPEEGPDFVAPMMYYSNYNSYAPYPKIGGHMELEQGGESANVLKKLHEEVGWPLTLTLTPDPDPNPHPNPHPHPDPNPHPNLTRRAGRRPASFSRTSRLMRRARARRGTPGCFRAWVNCWATPPSRCPSTVSHTPSPGRTQACSAGRRSVAWMARRAGTGDAGRRQTAPTSWRSSRLRQKLASPAWARYRYEL